MSKSKFIHSSSGINLINTLAECRDLTLLSSAQEKVASLDDIIRDREEMFGANGLFQIVNPPRMIHPPAGFVDPYRWWVLATETVVRDRGTDAGFVSRGVIQALREHASPTYFISTELLEAMERTDFGNAPMRDIEWAHPGMLFMLPERANSYYEVAMPDISTGRTHSVRVRAVGIGFAKVWSATENSNGIAVFIVDSVGACSWALIPFMDTWQEAVDYIGKNDMMSDEQRARYPWQSKLADLEKGALFTNCSLIFKVMCLWNSERSDGSSEVVRDGGRLIRAGNPKRIDRKKRDLWGGILLRLNEPVSRIISDDKSDERGVRRHWRRGHFRRQPHGAGRTLRKSIWIRPHMAGSL